MAITQSIFERAVCIDAQDGRIGAILGSLAVPEQSWGIVLFANDGESGADAKRDRRLAKNLHGVGLATLMINLYSRAEERASLTSKHRVDIGLMSDRLFVATEWAEQEFSARDFKFGYLGTGAGAAAALQAAAIRTDIDAVVSYNGLPALAGNALPDVTAATLLIVKDGDLPLKEWNAAACDRMSQAYRRELVVAPESSFTDKGSSDFTEAADLASRWFMRYLGAAAAVGVQRRRMSRGLPPNKPR